MSSPELPPPIVLVADPVVASLLALAGAVRVPVTLVGGWAVAARLRMARVTGRPTEDLDVLLSQAARPAAAALAAIDAVQEDDTHPCRLSGLPLLVDLLAEGAAAAVAPATEDFVVDEDGLRLLVPPMAGLLARASHDLVLESADASERRVAVRLPSAGALFAAKVANIALEFREPNKRASDAEDAVRLLLAFGAGGLSEDLRDARAHERARLLGLLGQLGASGLVAQARLSGWGDVEPERVEAVVGRLMVALTAQAAEERESL